MDIILSGFHGFGIFTDWHCAFPCDALSGEDFSQKSMCIEPRIGHLAKRINLKDANVLELGPMEGYHTVMVDSLGAKKIIAVEGRKENFLKCLIVKNAFNLSKCKFLYGDLSNVLSVLSGPFDVCLALGILYHLEDPIAVIHRIAGLANNLFAWTHYATNDYPKGRLVEIEYRNKVYRGKYVSEDPQKCLSGLHQKSFWILEEDIFKAVREAGFKDIELIHKEKAEHGPAILFLARK